MIAAALCALQLFTSIPSSLAERHNVHPWRDLSQKLAIDRPTKSLNPFCAGVVNVFQIPDEDAVLHVGRDRNDRNFLVWRDGPSSAKPVLIFVVRRLFVKSSGFRQRNVVDIFFDDNRWRPAAVAYGYVKPDLPGHDSFRIDRDVERSTFDRLRVLPEAASGQPKAYSRNGQNAREQSQGERVVRNSFFCRYWLGYVLGMLIGGGLVWAVTREKKR